MDQYTKANLKLDASLLRWALRSRAPPNSNLANFFASACDKRRPVIAFGTRHLRSSSWPSVKSSSSNSLSRGSAHRGVRAFGSYFKSVVFDFWCCSTLLVYDAAHMRFWQTIKRSPWPLKIIYFVLAFYLVFGLIAALAWFEFGRSAEQQVVELGWDLTTMAGIILAPVLLVGLIAVPVHRWISRKLVGFIEDRDRPQA